jgi:predicted GNAT family N-acyltransferase
MNRGPHADGQIVWSVRRAAAPPEDGASPWLDDVRQFRGEVLFADGRRRHFRDASGACADPDPLDAVACHALAHDGCGRLVGCIRLVPLAAHTTMTELLMGPGDLAASLARIGVPRPAVAEVSRWIVHPDWRGSHLGARLIAAIWALCARHDFAIALATVGTRDRQDVLLRRAGLCALPEMAPVESATYSDRLIFMYAHVCRPSRSFEPIVARMNNLLPPIPAEAAREASSAFPSSQPGSDAHL